MSRPRRGPTPALDRLTTDEQGQLLGELLAARPELVSEAERLALARLATVDAGEVAEDVERMLREADANQLAYRAGRVRGRGYVHENEAASEILEELLQPELDDLTRRPRWPSTTEHVRCHSDYSAVSPAASTTSKTARCSPMPALT